MLQNENEDTLFCNEAKCTIRCLLDTQIEDSSKKVIIQTEKIEHGFSFNVQLNENALPSDRGFLLGKNGRVMDSIRTLMITYGARYKKKVVVKLV